MEKQNYSTGSQNWTVGLGFISCQKKAQVDSDVQVKIDKRK